MPVNNKEIESFNYLKAFACCFIVLIHCRFPGYIGNVVRTIAKFGVPFFYMVSGYFFLYGENCEYVQNKTKDKILHVFKIIVNSALFYWLFSLFYIFVLRQSLELDDVLVPRGIVKLFVANSPFVYSHLWFLGALLYCYITAGLLKEKIRGRWKKKIIILLLMMFVCMSEILPAFGLKITILEIPLYNIFFFRAFPFFLMGIYMKENKKLIVSKVHKRTKKELKCIIALGFLLSVVERILLVESQFYMGTFIAVFMLFIYCMAYPVGYNKTIQYIGKYLSMYIYILHIAIMKLFDLGSENRLNIIKPIIVILMSMFASILVVMFTHWMKQKKCIKEY